MNNSQRLSIDETIEYFIDRNEIFIFLQISFHLMNIFLFTQKILIVFLYQKGIFRIVHLDYRSEKNGFEWTRRFRNEVTFDYQFIEDCCTVRIDQNVFNNSSCRIKLIEAIVDQIDASV